MPTRFKPSSKEPAVREDDLGTNDEEYEFKKHPDRFYVPANDETGTSIRVAFRLSPQHHRQLQVIQQGGRFPYETMEDLLRHAVCRHLRYLTAVAPDIEKHWLVAAMTIDELVKDDAMAHRVEETLQRFEDRIRAHEAAGDSVECERLCAVVQICASGIHDHRWVARFMEKFKQKYEKYLSI